MQFKILADLESPEFKQASTLYLNSFPQNETRPIAKTKELLKNHNYKLFVIIEDDTVVGISFLYIFDDFSLLDYMAVLPEKQGKGIGSKMFKNIIEFLRKNYPQINNVFLEIQKENASNKDNTNRIRRILFYKKLGNKLLIDNYLLPPYHGNKAQEMYLLVYPIHKASSFSKEDVLRIISDIYVKVYDYKKNNLIKETSKDLDDDLMLQEIIINE